MNVSSESPSKPGLSRPRPRRLLLGVAGGAVLALVFMAYLQPSFMVDLANRIYLCF
ncbi:hypothetical protein PQR62_22680 [Herbaspirillum lusitanum]|uniref:Uncharacterized protein n=1 Tax=Herbaspirillum lusitanum TaxID=213312 RepID=A0ABW9AEU3_9BURK